ncbi:hypothetical protein SNQ22_004136 [Cronobacter universalis]|nr:hypothetical protein [Cronobacter universalis]
MKVNILKAFIGLSVLSSAYAFSANTISLNFAQGAIPGADHIRGGNIQLMHDIDSIGVAGAFTWIEKTKSDNYGKIKYASASLGPTFKLSDAITSYGQAGIACGSKFKGSQTEQTYGPSLSAGINVRANSYLSFNAGYEAGWIEHKQINIFYTGFGFSF